jgi:hypothetical protein
MDGAVVGVDDELAVGPLGSWFLRGVKVSTIPGTQNSGTDLGGWSETGTMRSMTVRSNVRIQPLSIGLEDSSGTRASFASLTTLRDSVVLVMRLVQSFDAGTESRQELRIEARKVMRTGPSLSPDRLSRAGVSAT